MTDLETLDRALCISAACLLPTLNHDCDSKPISPADFDEFRIMLDNQLYLLLDQLYQNRDLLLKSEAFDNQLVQLRVNVFLLACEQTEPNPFFQADQEIIIDSLARLIDLNLQYFKDEKEMKKIVQAYKDGLKKDCWKKNLGLLHGFPKFCEIIVKKKPEIVNKDLLLFIISVGSKLTLHHDPHFKTIGLKVYRHVMAYVNNTLLTEMNIHEVIYSETFRMLRKSNEIYFTDHIYECLLHTVSINDRDENNSRWCKYDDVLEELLTQSCSESDVKVCRLLMKKLMKFCRLFYEDIEVDPEINSDNYYDELRSKTKRTNIRTMRWIKRLMQMMVSESSKLLGTDCWHFLHAYHSIYILTMSNTDPKILGQQLIDFTKKIILLLMQVVRIHKNDKSVIKSVVLFMKTIEQHQQGNQELISCLQKLCNHEALLI